MIEAHIADGDLALVKPQPTAENGEIVAALVGDEATLKYFYKEKNPARTNEFVHSGWRVRLQPANARMNPIIIDNPEIPVTIVGKVVAIIRQLAKP